MGYPTSDEIRAGFLDFFRAKGGGHTIVASSPVVPHDDPTLLFTNAGMNQFKPLFLGTVDPSSPLAGLKRAADTQKCIRAGGKHNDLEDVGKDTYHHTFFEMLGNWSFGDYFKKEAIDWAWELLTGVFKIPPDRLYATYFGGDKASGLEPDEESKALWLEHLPAGRVIPGSMKDNFWEMGDTGPCGPCSEIHYDRVGQVSDLSVGQVSDLSVGQVSDLSVAQVSDLSRAALVNTGDPDVVELWNLVFIQFDRQGPTSLKPLPARHVDTGMGLERLTSVLQNVTSNYDTDLFAPIFAAIELNTSAPRPYMGKVGAKDEGNVDTAYRVIADHVRTLSFAIADGATPSNEGRGYVLRRVLRRAVRYGRQMLGAKTGFLSLIVPSVVKKMGHAFPELVKHQDRIVQIIKEEEESFGRTLDRGIDIFKRNAIATAAAQYNLERQKQPREERTYAGPWGGRHISEMEADSIHKGVIPDRLLPFSEEDDVVIASADSLHRIIDRFPADMDAIERLAKLCKNTPMLNGEVAFMLYDTYGFPLDLTQIMAEERGLAVDVAGFEKCMEEQRERSRAGANFVLKAEAGSYAVTGSDATFRVTRRLALPADAVARLRHMGVAPTDDIDKFHGRSILADVKAIWNGTDFDVHVRGNTQRVGVILDKTNHYAESGGQVGDQGRLTVIHEDKSSAADDNKGGEFRVQRTGSDGGFILHEGLCTRGEIRVGDRVELRIDHARRSPTMANHTATHMLNFALRSVLGDAVEQKGSLVEADRLRFDFSHTRPMTAEELAKAESIVRRQIDQDLTVYTDIVPLNVARQISGVRAVFGETYPDPVRVVSVGQPVDEMTDSPDNPAWREVSIEFCGGTHLASTSEAQAFAIVSETGIAKGVRRIEAVTGAPAMAAIAAGDQCAAAIESAAKLDGDALEREVSTLNAQLDGLTMSVARKAALRKRLTEVQNKAKGQRKERERERAKLAAGRAAQIADAALMNGDEVIVDTIEVGSDRSALQQALKTIQTKAPRAAVMLLSPDADAERVAILAGVPDAIVKRGLDASAWVRHAAEACGGKGGGKPTSAQGSGTDVGKLGDALKVARREAFRVLA